MPEVIRFAWGNSSLGEFMVAMSDKGLVALELGSSRDSAEEALRIRFPDAEVVSRQLELVDILDKHVANPKPDYDKGQYGVAMAECEKFMDLKPLKSLIRGTD